MTLPLRDYYPIERAAKLLCCDIDDLIHWAVTGCIRICIEIESAYGVLNIPDEKDVVNFDCLRKFMDTESRKLKLSDIEISSEGTTGNDQCSYRRYKSVNIYDAMCESLMHSHMSSKFGDEKLDNAFALLSYYNVGQCIGDNYKINSVYYLDINESVIDSVPSVLKCVQERFPECFVEISGIFVLGGGFFMNRKLRKVFCANNLNINYGNIVTPPDIDMPINVIVCEDVSFDINDLCVLKNDFLKVQNAINSGEELKKEYINTVPMHLYLRARNSEMLNCANIGKDETSKQKHNAERLSKTMKDFFRAMLVIHYKELENNPVKLADILTAEAREVGLNMRFDKSTISRWIKASSQ